VKLVALIVGIGNEIVVIVVVVVVTGKVTGVVLP